MRPRFRSAYAATLAVIAAAAPLPVFSDDGLMHLNARAVQAHDPAECVCRAQGRTFAVGESACLRTAMGARVAHCGMVLNNTSWHFTERPCPES
jgi:hypothetical protein